jgi:hypothetical protein
MRVVIIWLLTFDLRHPSGNIELWTNTTRLDRANSETVWCKEVLHSNVVRSEVLIL